MTVTDENIGTWLLDPRLVGKFLDVHVGFSPNQYRGKWEKEIGWLCLQHPPPLVTTLTPIRVGHVDNPVQFMPCQLSPERTVEPSLARDNRPPGITTYPYIHQKLNTRVVVIGPDSRGDEQWIGSYGLTVYSPYPEWACVWIVLRWPPPPFDGSPPICSYFALSSLCRSNPWSLIAKSSL